MKEIETIKKELKGACLEWFRTFPHYSDYVEGLRVVEVVPAPRAINQELERQGQNSAPAVALMPAGDLVLIRVNKYGSASALTYSRSGDIKETWRARDAEKIRVKAARLFLLCGEIKKSNGHQSAELLARDGERFTPDGRAASGYNLKYGYKLDVERWELDPSGYCLNFFRMEQRRRLWELKAAKRAAQELRAKELKEAEIKKDAEASHALRLALFGDRYY